MSTLKPKDKCRVKSTGSDLDGLIAYITECLGPQQVKRYLLRPETVTYYRATLPAKPNLPPLTFAAEELELIK